MTMRGASGTESFAPGSAKDFAGRSSLTSRKRDVDDRLE